MQSGFWNLLAHPSPSALWAQPSEGWPSVVLITSLSTVLSEAPFLTKLRPPWVRRPRGSVSSLRLQPGGGRRPVLRSVSWVAAHGSLVLCGVVVRCPVVQKCRATSTHGVCSHVCMRFLSPSATDFHRLGA